MKKTRKSNGTLETLLVIGLILIIPLFFVIRTAAVQNTTPNTPEPSLPTEANAPALPTAANTEEDNAMKPKQPPACTFPLVEIKAEESMPEGYIFSEPKVVLDKSYNLVEWLPDNQQILMTELSDQTEMGKPPTEVIEIYNPDTGEIKVYATHPQANAGLPVWQPELNAVVYPSMNFTGIDKKTYHPIFTRQLWVSYGNPNTVQMLADNMSQFPIAVKPGGGEMFYLADKKLDKLDKSLKKLSSALFDPAQWDYGKGPRNQDPIVYNMAWQPSTQLVFLYSNGSALQMGGYTFIMDANTGKVCELDFGGWATKALWSPDGRYLAVIRAKEYAVSSGNVFDMTVLDTVTGELHITEVLPPSVEFNRYVDNFVWAPDNRHLLAVGPASSQNRQNNGSSDLFELYLVDFMAGESVTILPEYSGFFTPNLAWSPDGTKLAIDCKPNRGYSLCLISVNVSGK